MVWTGRMARARPSWATEASRQAYSFVSRALVATTARVVLSPPGGACPSPRSTSRVLAKPPPSPRGPAMTWPLAVDDLAEGVDRHQGGNRQVACGRQGSLAVPMPPLRPRSTPNLGDGGAGARADVALGDASTLAGDAGAIAALGVGAHVAATDEEVEEDGAQTMGTTPPP